MLCISDRQIDRTVQEAASGNDTLTGNCVHKSADFLLSTIYPWKTGSFYASISSTIYPWKTGSFYASISRWVITYCFDINVKICNVLICLELIKMLPKSIHQIAPFSFQNSKIFQLLRGHIPPQTPPCARKRAIGADAPPNHPPQCSKRIYAPEENYAVRCTTSIPIWDCAISVLSDVITSIWGQINCSWVPKLSFY